MGSERNGNAMDVLTRLMINVGAVAIVGGLIALVIATIISYA